MKALFKGGLFKPSLFKPGEFAGIGVTPPPIVIFRKFNLTGRYSPQRGLTGINDSKRDLTGG